MATTTDGMAQIARDLQQQATREGTMVLATQLAVQTVRGCDAAGISLVRARREITIEAPTSEAVQLVAKLQDESGEGPCLDALWDHELVYSPDLSIDPRWPIWGPAMVEQIGFNSVLSVRLFTHDRLLGALNMYSSRTDAFDQEDQDTAVALASHVAVAIASAQSISTLEAALDTRSVIGQAIGRLCERYDMSADAAFALLQRLSSTHNLKLIAVARDVVTTGRLPGSEPV